MQYRKGDAIEETTIQKKNKNSSKSKSTATKKACVDQTLKDDIMQLCRNSDAPYDILKSFLLNLICQDKFEREVILVTSIIALACFVNELNGADKKKEMARISSFSKSLKPLVNGSDQELILLNALQESLVTEKLQRGSLLRWFMTLYDEEVVQEEVFLEWKESVDPRYEGKGVALIQVNKWLTWLEEAEEDSGDEEEEEVDG